MLQYKYKCLFGKLRNIDMRCT